MNKNQVSGKHRRGRGRIYLGLGLSSVALFWLAKKVGWLGVDSHGIIWPLLAIGVGLVIAMGNRFGTSDTYRDEEISHGGGRK